MEDEKQGEAQFAVPAMAMFTLGRITERLNDPTTLLAQEKAQEEKQEVKPLESQPVQAVQHVVTTHTKTNLSMVSDLVDWSQVGACLEKKDNCVCYGHKAQRLNIAPETCQAAVKFGWIGTKKL